MTKQVNRRQFLGGDSGLDCDGAWHRLLCQPAEAFGWGERPVSNDRRTALPFAVVDGQSLYQYSEYGSDWTRGCPLRERHVRYPLLFTIAGLRSSPDCIRTRMAFSGTSPPVVTTRSLFPRISFPTPRPFCITRASRQGIGAKWHLGDKGDFDCNTNRGAMPRAKAVTTNASWTSVFPPPDLPTIPALPGILDAPSR